MCLGVGAEGAPQYRVVGEDRRTVNKASLLSCLPSSSTHRRDSFWKEPPKLFFTLLPRINTSGSKINIKRNSTSREFQHYLQISSCPQFTGKKGSGAPFDESIEGLGNGTLSVDRSNMLHTKYG